LGFEKSQRSVTHDSLRYRNILSFLLTFLQMTFHARLTFAITAKLHHLFILHATVVTKPVFIYW